MGVGERRCREVLGRCGKVWWGVGMVKGDVGRSVGGVEGCGKCREMLREVWGSVLGCGGRCEKLLGEVWGNVGGGVGKSVGMWGR